MHLTGAYAQQADENTKSMFLRNCERTMPRFLLHQFCIVWLQTKGARVRFAADDAASTSAYRVVFSSAVVFT